MKKSCCPKGARLDTVVARAEGDLAGLAKRLSRDPDSARLRTLLEKARFDRDDARLSLKDHVC